MNFYDSFIEGAQGSSPRERGDFYVAVLEYLYYDGRMPEFKLCKWADQAFTMIRPILDSQLAKQRAGSKGGRMRAINQAEGQASAQAEAKQAEANLTGTVTGTEKELPDGSSKKRPRFIPPTVEEVDAYLTEKGLSAYLTGTQFVGYYGSQDWKKANGRPVTNWKLAASGWADRERKRSPKEGGERHAEYD